MGLNGPSAGQSLVDWVREVTGPDPLGGTALTPEYLGVSEASYAENLLPNSSFESFSAGTTSAPDGWTLTGTGSTIARNTTSGQIHRGLASVSVTAALNTATDLAQSLTISATQNTQLRGRRVTFSCYVRTGTAGRVFLRIDDGVGTTDSVFETIGDSTFRRLAVSRLLDASATKVEVSCEISSGASITVQFDAAKLEIGDSPTEWVANARDPFLQSRVASSTASTTTQNTAMSDLDTMSIANVIVDGTQSVLVLFQAAISVDLANLDSIFQIVRDSTVIPATGIKIEVDPPVAGQSQFIAMAVLDSKPAAGNYTYTIQWAHGGTINVDTLTASQRVMQVAPIPSA